MRRLPLLLSSLFASALLVVPGLALQGPDVVTSQVGGGNDFVYYGQSGGIAAYSFATTSCNIGNQTVIWQDNTLSHPVIGQNIFRLKDGRFEQLGQSWLKHGFCAVNEPSCGNCQGTPCSTLGIGCADTYWGTLNDGQGGRPKWPVNASSGAHTHAGGSPTGSGTIRGRLQVATVDLLPASNPGARFFAEAQYVTADDSQFGHHKNNASWKEITFNAGAGINQVSNTTNVGQPAIQAWKSVDPAVTIVEIQVANEGGAGVHGWYFLGYRVIDNGNGTWSYNYALQNLTSDRGVRSFVLPLSNGAQISNVYFRNVLYHSGEIYDNTPWAYSEGAGELGWASTQTHAQNPNANAIRWGTMYTFSFVSESGPIAGTAEMEMFKPGSPSVLTAPVLVPDTGSPSVGTGFCAGDGSAAFCPCINYGDAGHGCENGTFPQGAHLRGQGSDSVIGDDLTLLVSSTTPSQPGLFFQGNNAINGGDGSSFGDGIRCAGGNVQRLQVLIANGSGEATSTTSIATQGGVGVGDTRRYQWWYRDPVLSPCGNFFNFSNGLEVTWTP